MATDSDDAAGTLPEDDVHAAYADELESSARIELIGLGPIII